jgi:hypothetical protein
MTRRLVCVLSIALLAAGLGACGSDSPARVTPVTRGNTPVKLSETGACGEAFFWAANPEGTLAVTLTVEVRKRSTTAPTTIDFTVPDPRVNVEIERGRGILGALCSDVITPSFHVDSRPVAVKGKGRVTVDPSLAKGCGAKGRMHLDGLVSRDGTRFAAIDVSTKSIGCYAG